MPLFLRLLFAPPEKCLAQRLRLSFTACTAVECPLHTRASAKGQLASATLQTAITIGKAPCCTEFAK